MEKNYNINDGELIILLDVDYNTFLNLGNKIVINKNIKSIYNSATNFKAPIKFVEGNYDTSELNKKNIIKPDFKTLILGPMTKIKITYSNSNLNSRSTSDLVLNNHSKDSIYVSQANINIKNIGDSLLNIKVINLNNVPNSNSEIVEFNNLVSNLEKTNRIASFSRIESPKIIVPEKKQCMKLDKFLIYLILTILIIYLIFNLSKK